MAEAVICDFAMVCSVHGIVMMWPMTRQRLDEEDRHSPPTEPCTMGCTQRLWPALIYEGPPGNTRTIQLDIVMGMMSKVVPDLDSEIAHGVMNLMEAFLQSDVSRVWCSCGRGQKDLGERDLQAIGWTKDGDRWCCPFCDERRSSQNTEVGREGI